MTDDIPMMDGLQSLATGLGTSRDKAASASYTFTPLNPAQLETAYRSAPLARKIVDLPAEDAFRHWREWQAEAVDISKIEAEEKRLGIQGKAIRAIKAARLHGGAAIYIGTRDQNTAMPLNPRAIGLGGLQYLHVLGRHELNAARSSATSVTPAMGVRPSTASARRTAASSASTPRALPCSPARTCPCYRSTLRLMPGATAC